MGRKVLLSFLGAGSLKKCYYYYQDIAQKQPATRFVQEAIIRTFCQNWTTEDTQIFFLTDRAKSANWEDNLEFNDDRGLKTLLTDLKATQAFTHLQPVAVSIKDGNTVEEIWEIFAIVFAQLQPEDEVYLDVTNAFRSIPMLSLVLLNYAKFLKKIQVKAILYGNFEAKNKAFEAPIIDITSFSELQDWTSAANEFLNFGNTDRFLQLADQSANNHLKAFAQTLHQFTQELATVRGNQIYEGSSATNLTSLLPQMEQLIDIAPFKPILEEIKLAMKDFDSREIKNFFVTAKFCFDHNLIQQAITLLQEGIVCFTLNKLSQDWRKYDLRKIASGAFSHTASKYKPQTKLAEELNIAQKVWDFSLFAQLSTVYKDLNRCRNDINHAGLDIRAASAQEIYQITNQTLIQIQSIGLL